MEFGELQIRKHTLTFTTKCSWPWNKVLWNTCK